MKKIEEPRLFYIEKGEYVYSPVVSDNCIYKVFGKTEFYQKDNVVGFKQQGEVYEQRYKNESDAKIELKRWIRSFLKGEF